MIYVTLLLLLLFIFYMVFKAHHDTIDYRTIYDHRLPIDFDNYKIFFITDIHRRTIHEKTLKQIKTQIDLVLIGGDLTEKGVPFPRTRCNLQKLQKLGAPIYFVWGNNDYEVSINMLKDILNDEDVTSLNDTHINIVRNGKVISLFGFDDDEDNDDRQQISWDNVKGDYFILLTHKPSSFYQLTTEKRKRFQTVFAGHTHGGQIRLFGLGFYEKGGLKTYQDTNIFISEGYGYTFLPFRLQTNAECHVITLKKFKNLQ